MPLESKYALRVSSIPDDTTKEQFADFVRSLSAAGQDFKKKSMFSSLKVKHWKKIGQDHFGTPTEPSSPVSPSANGQDDAPLIRGIDDGIRTSFADQHGLRVGTIAFPSKEAAELVLKRHEKARKSSNAMHQWRDWDLSSSFQGITVLYEPKQDEQQDREEKGRERSEGVGINMDICAVHGLGGNAIDTWNASDKGIMWLRDYLPSSEYFSNSRIMTFGYDSDLTDPGTVAGLDNWAESLIHCLSEERARPLLLVCHSLGGLVARKAMSQLPTSSIRGITLSQCGLVFLATPHTGTTKADWSNFIVAAAGTVAGVRPEVVSHLQSFNPASVWDKKAFLKLTPRPPFRCFAEGRRKLIRGTYQHVVTQGSASLDPENPALMIPQDHSGICKFSTKLGAYITISSALNQVFFEVTGRLEPEQGHERRMFGHPRFLACAYPPYKKFWWEGSEMNEIQYRLTLQTPLVGRNEEMGELEKAVAQPPARPKLTVVKGIAGIGKTEVLMRFTAKHRYRRNIFFLRAHNSKKLEDALAAVCNSIGFDMIENPNINWERWRRTETPERIQIFVDWLGKDFNKDSLLIMDDAEIFGAASIQAALKYPAWHIVMSTRDSNLKGPGRESQDLRLAPLTVNDTALLLQNSLHSLSPEDSQLLDEQDFQRLSRAIQGHPLAAQNVIPFLLEYLGTFDDPTEEFVRILGNGTGEERRIFFKFAARDRSLWDAFNSSLELLKQKEGSENAVKLLQILPYLRTDDDCIDSFLKTSKKGLLPGADVSAHGAILRSEYLVVSKWLEKLRDVSLFVSSGPRRSKRLDIHPLVLQFAQLLPSDEARKHQIRDMLQLFYEFYQRQAEDYVVPHVNHCLDICSRFEISPRDLGLSPNVISWLETISTRAAYPTKPSGSAQQLNDSFMQESDSIKENTKDFILLCARTQKKLKDVDFHLGNGGQNQQLVLKCVGAFRALKGSLRHDDAYCGLQPLAPLEDAIRSLSEMVRSTSIYPELPLELDKFRSRCRASVEMNNDSRVVELDETWH
ncbi:hypothetical protein MRS44_012325 [Fusarium solani]|uniref:uncharacterized protein n=1 Tax=Fusarium solani TaxID=169388 RepID=UPI0032C4303D|nr:hypothetical protein MRS44_012325 [Fusarium solani]